MTYERVAKLASVRELWLWCIGSGLLACDSELLADYLVLDGMIQCGQSCHMSCSPPPEPCGLLLQAAVLHKVQAEVILHAVNKRLLSQQFSIRVMPDRTAAVIIPWCPDQSHIP